MTAQSYKIMTAHQLGEALRDDPEGARILRYFQAKGWGGFMIQIPIVDEPEQCPSEQAVS